MVRGISGYISGIITHLGGRAAARKKLNISKSLLDNYLLRDSYPLDFLQHIIEVSGKNVPLRGSKLAAKGIMLT